MIDDLSKLGRRRSALPDRQVRPSRVGPTPRYSDVRTRVLPPTASRRSRADSRATPLPRDEPADALPINVSAGRSRDAASARDSAASRLPQARSAPIRLPSTWQSPKGSAPAASITVSAGPPAFADSLDWPLRGVVRMHVGVDRVTRALEAWRSRFRHSSSRPWNHANLARSRRAVALHERQR